MNYLHNKFQIWNTCVQKGNSLINKGLAFYAAGEPKRYQSIDILREELAVNARYLHRGFYCPSPIQDVIVKNSSRGKILLRQTKKSKITHQYFYNLDNQLIISESNLPNGKKKREYLVYDNNVVYGYAFDSWGTLIGVSEEVYKEDRLQSYFCASCFNHEADHLDFGITNIHYEIYHYDGAVLHDAEYYFSNFWSDELKSPEEANALIQGNRYGVVYQNKKIISCHILSE